MEYNDYRIMSPKDFEEIAKAYNQNNDNIPNDKKIIEEKIQTLDAYYSCLSKRAFFRPRKEFFINMISNIPAMEKPPKIRFISCKNLIRQELELINLLSSNNENDKIIKKRTDNITKLLTFL